MLNSIGNQIIKFRYFTLSGQNISFGLLSFILTQYLTANFICGLKLLKICELEKKFGFISNEQQF